MRLLLIRHGDPDYDLDDLTEAGKREAVLLSERIAPLEVEQYFVSPLGRAAATAAPTLRKAERQAVVLDWLKEFSIPIHRPDREDMSPIPWDWLPEDWLADERLLSAQRWRENEILKEAGVGKAYDQVIAEFDALLSQYGYERNGLLYRVRCPNQCTLVFFTHLGLSCLLLSHLLNCSPFVLWQGTAPAPSSVTTVYTEERRAGTAIFRVTSLGDVAHLYANNTKPSFAARFCETYGNGDRVD